MKKILVLIISLSVVLVGCGNEIEPTETGTSGTIGSALTYNEFTISLDDAYYANYPHDGIEINFDRYLAADFTITNNSDASTIAKTLTHFTVVDKNNNLSRVMIDENRKKFSSNLMPGDSFKITLVFPVNLSDEYTINYSYGATTNKENVLSWTFKIKDGETKDVDQTVQHRDVNEVLKTFLLGDGSKKIGFEYKPADEKTSEVSSEVTANE